MPSSHHRIRRTIWPTLLLAGLLMLLAMPAAAHSALQSAEPAPDSTTDEPVQTLTLVFAEPIDVLPESIMVAGPDGQPLPVGASSRAADGVTVSATLGAPLPTGTSTVAWRVIGGDGHPIEGTYTVTSIQQPAAVGADAPTSTVTPSAAASSSLAGEPRAPEIVQTAGRWLAFAAILVAMGVIAFGVAVHPDSRADQQLLSRLVTGAAIAVIIGATLQLLGHVAVIAGEGMTGATDMAAWGIVRRSGYMTASLLRIAGGAVLLVGARGFVRWSHDPSHVGPLLLGAAALLLSFQFTGHTATSTPTLLVRIADAAHVTAAAVWTGGVVALSAVLAARRRRRDDTSLVVGRFSVAATGAVVLVGVAGTALAVIELESVGQLFTSGYGRILLGKLAIVGLVAAVGAFNHTRLVPAIVGGDDRAAARMQRTMRMELGLFPVAIALTAVLVRMSP
ncbi:copper resistance CopC/CopD family protein [Euzebya pacifica]|uniref:copper resistance CopC/CopD family protein n=1 Tax=Euzebya pacifica TaxID=1608957 RepID=UPI0030FCF882